MREVRALIVVGALAVFFGVVHLAACRACGFVEPTFLMASIFLGVIFLVSLFMYLYEK